MSAVSQWTNWESKSWPHGKVYILDVHGDSVRFRNYAGSNGTMQKSEFMKKYKKLKKVASKRRNPRPAKSNVVHIPAKLDAFMRGYMEAAVWSSTDIDSGEPLSKNYSESDFSARALSAIVRDCKQFQEDNAEDLSGGDSARAGQDFWLTRNRHGAGFWDGDWEREAGKRLTDDAHSYGELDIIVNRDGQLTFYGE